MRLILAAFASFGLLFFISSCKTIKPTGYFQTLQRDTTIQGFVSPSLDVKISSGDQLGISINSLSTEENLKFNNTILSGTQTMASTPAYPVDGLGNIKMHRLGLVQVAGLTRKELEKKLENALTPYLKEPLVNVSFLNHKVTVMGGVARPQVIGIQGDNMTVIDALVLAGDIGKEGRKDNVLIIRDSLDKKIIKKLNLEDHTVFSSPWSYLQPNDIVYVVPDYLKQEREERKRNLQTTLSLTVSVISLLLVILTRVIK